MTTRAFVHIGLPKTGTTSLQRNVFDRHPGVHYLGRSKGFSTDQAKLVLRAILDSREGPTLRPAAVDALHEIRDGTKALVISDEALSLGAFMSRAQLWEIPSDHRAIAERTRELLGDADIAIVLRNQLDWLISWHRQGLKSRRYTEPSIDDWLNGSFADRAEELYSLLDFEDLYASYTDVFGSDRVHVWLYESYRDRFYDLAFEMASIGGFDPHQARELALARPENVTDSGYRGISAPMFRLLRSGPAAKVASAAPRPLRKKIRDLASTEIDFGEGPSSELQGLVADRFESSNRHLLQKLELGDSGELGYVNNSAK